MRVVAFRKRLSHKKQTGGSTMSVLTITSENFKEEVLDSKEVVLLDFWASWCGPCQMLSPVIDEVAEELSNVKVGKINVDEQEELARKYGIMTIPTLVVIKDGVEINRSAGVIPKESILNLVK